MNFILEIKRDYISYNHAWHLSNLISRARRIQRMLPIGMHKYCKDNSLLPPTVLPSLSHSFCFATAALVVPLVVPAKRNYIFTGGH